jgi:hypothetical protein
MTRHSATISAQLKTRLRAISTQADSINFRKFTARDAVAGTAALEARLPIAMRITLPSKSTDDRWHYAVRSGAPSRPAIRFFRD